MCVTPLIILQLAAAGRILSRWTMKTGNTRTGSNIYLEHPSPSLGAITLHIRIHPDTQQKRAMALIAR